MEKMKKKVYLDICCLNRPFDDQTQERIRLEAEALLLILEAVQESRCELIGSRVLDVENRNNPDEEKRREIGNCLRLAGTYVYTDRNVLERAGELQGSGFDAYDAMHLACAEQANADVFITTDDKIRKKSEQVDVLKVRVVNPVDLVGGFNL